MATFFQEGLSRRQFVAGSLGTLGLVPMLSMSSATLQQDITVQQLIDLILKEIPGTVSNTVDTIKTGDPNQKITGIVTSMFPTIEVIRQTIALKANFLIVHEPSFYNHQDDTSWLKNDEVFQYKKELLEKNGIAVWRFHDYIHRHNPDGILEGVVQKLGWKKFQNASKPQLFSLPAEVRLWEIIAEAKNKLAIPNLRMVGSLDDKCKKILLLPGAWGGRPQITQLMESKPDLVICGEVSEWETSEYIRDARSIGLKRALLVLGHVQSEEPGLAWLVSWLNDKAPGIRATHIPSQNPFTFA